MDKEKDVDAKITVIPTAKAIQAEKSKIDFEKGRADAAQDLRDIADAVEAGEIHSFVLVGLEGDHTICSSAKFDDRLALLGALDYAKTKVVLE